MNADLRFYLLVALIVGLHAKISEMAGEHVWSLFWMGMGFLYFALFVVMMFERHVVFGLLKFALWYSKASAFLRRGKNRRSP